MLADIKKLPSFIAKSLGFEKDTSITAVVTILEKHLSGFFPNISNEDGITQLLCEMLNISHYPFYFQQQHKVNKKSGHSFKPDIGVFHKDNIFYSSDRKCFFHIEAKILGVTNKKNEREKEYLIGKYGGVERFKKGKHGVEIRNGKKEYLPYSALLGYVRKENFDYWYKQINCWIDELIENTNDPEINWSDKDKLEILKTSSPEVAKYKTINSRVNAKSIIIMHLWVMITPRY